MKVPDPEDSIYWYYDAKDLQKKFNERKYVEDFRKWKDKLRKLTQTYPFDEFWFDKVGEILGEEFPEE